MNLNLFRQALLDLHKALLDAQRIRYEREHGRVGSSGEYLKLVVEHRDFEWLRALSALIVRLDEWGDDQAGGAELDAILAGARDLMAAEGTHPTFGTRYREMIDAEPDVLIAHVKLWRLLG